VKLDGRLDITRLGAAGATVGQTIVWDGMKFVAATLAHETDATDAHDASAVSYAGSSGLSATDVEAALDELDTEKASAASFPAGAWTAYTPTIAGTGWAIGDGISTGEYVLLGKTVHFRARIIWGATSTFGAADALSLSLPLATKGGTGGREFTGRATDTSAAKQYLLQGLSTGGASTTLMRSLGPGGLGEFVAMTATTPFTWAASDVVNVFGTYETT
jgi:hypothetical protein